MVPTKKTTRKKTPGKAAARCLSCKRLQKRVAELEAVNEKLAHKYEEAARRFEIAARDYFELQQQMEESEEARECEAFLKQVDTDRKRLFGRAAAGKAH